MAALEDRLRQLSDASFSVRQEAEMALIVLGTNAYRTVFPEILRLFRDRQADAEARGRALNVLREIAIWDRYDRPRGFIGITPYTAVLKDAKGRKLPCISIRSVVPDTPAEKAGLTTSDLIISVNKKRIGASFTYTDFINWVQQFAPGDTLQLGLARPEGLVEVDLVLTNRPATIPGFPAATTPQNVSRASRESWFDRWIEKQHPPPAAAPDAKAVEPRKSESSRPGQ